MTAAAAARCTAAFLFATCLAGPAARAQPASPPAAPQALVQAPVVGSGPRWSELTAAQQLALQPLSPHWDGLGEPHKRKWIALSRNFASLTPEGQTTLHSRMSDWASLSFQQRAQARLNFAEIQRLAADERKAKWEAYKALSDDERARLAKRVPRSPGAALALQPVPLQKLAPTPALSATDPRSPRIQLAPPVAAAPRPVSVPVGAEAPPKPQQAVETAQ